MTNIPNTEIIGLKDINSTLLLNISEHEIRNTYLKSISLRENLLEIQYQDENKLMVYFTIDNEAVYTQNPQDEKSHRITGIRSINQGGDNTEFIEFLYTEDSKFSLFGEEVRILYGDEDAGVDDGINTHISHVIKRLINYRPN